MAWPRTSPFEWQHLIIRIYLGLDFIHHFGEKFGLLGQQSYENALKYFQTTVPDNPSMFLLVAGLCEFGAFIGLTFGVFTRAAAIGTALYLMIAAVMGGHFSNGFTWANAGGGWEYPVLWSVLILSFTITGGGRYSVDAWLRIRMPRCIRWLAI
jgi:putative oxidoreductase